MPNSVHLLSEIPLWVASPVTWREACFSLPAMRALADTQELHILCPDAQKDFWMAAKLGEVTGYSETVQPKSLARQLPSIAQCLLWEDGIVASAMTYVKVPYRLGIPARRLIRRLTHPITLAGKLGPPDHLVQIFLEAVKHLGVGPLESRHFAPLPSPYPRIDDAWLISPESDFGRHFEWPLDRWIDLLYDLTTAGKKTHVLGGGPIAQQLADATSSERVDSIEPAHFASFSHCLATDSSIPHIAAAFGVPCTVLFGPDDPERTRPLGKQHQTIRKKAECSPCLMDQCQLDLRCQLELEIAHVRSRLTCFAR